MRASKCLVGIVAALAMGTCRDAPLDLPYNETLRRHEEIANPELMPRRYTTGFVRSADGRIRTAVFDLAGNYAGFLQYRDPCLERERTGGNWRFNQGVGDASGDLRPPCGDRPDETQRFYRAHPTREHQIVDPR